MDNMDNIGKSPTEEDNIEEPPKKRRKGVINVLNYKRNSIKKARVKGTAHKNHKEQEVAAKSIGSSCQCAMKCFTKLTEEQRMSIFSRLYNLETKDEQDIFLQGLIEVKEVSQRRPKNSNGTVRKHSFVHYVMVEQKKVKVCLGAFLSLYAVSSKRVKRLKSLLLKNETPRDNRGKKMKTNAVPDHDIVLIRQHIECFPYKESHYSGKTYRYLDTQLNVKIMCDLFKEKYPDSRIKYAYYNKCFREQYILHFGRPQVDTCIECEQLNLKIKSPTLGEAGKRAAQADLMIHKRRSKKFYNALQKTIRECQQDNSIAALCFDYMQNVHLPEVPVQDVFYMSQLNVNVFCIHDLRTGKAFFYIYHEGMANKGPNEVCSFLLDYVENYVEKDTKELRLFSDNCPGQNKNHTLIRMCMALVDTKRFNKVQQFYPLRGHSFLPCDRDFGVIKRKLKRYDRIFSMHDYTEIIVSSSALRKFTVKEVQTNDIVNFKDWWAYHYKKTTLSMESQGKAVPRKEKVDFSISKFSHSVHDTDSPGIVTASEFIQGFVTHHFKLNLPKRNRRIDMPTDKAYPDNKVPLLSTKLKYLEALVQYVPEERQEFYYDIINNWETKETHKNK